MDDKMSSEPTFDLCIVGAGMIGSCAARHASVASVHGRSLAVCLIGPEEPQIRAGHTVFGAYFDEGRITRSIAADASWSVLASRSMARHRVLEQQTGIRFYEEVGCLYMSDALDSLYVPPYLTGVKEPQRLDADQLHDKFPYLFTSRDHPPPPALLQVADAGYVNPRQLCRAAQEAARRAGCDVIRDVASGVDATSDGRLRVTTDGGWTAVCGKVLLATGAFTEFRRLFPTGVQLDLRHVEESVMFVELSTADIARLQNMPSMSVFKTKQKLPTGEEFGCYILPPIKYPDGKVYVKIGHGSQYQNVLQTPADIVNWYLGEVPGNVKASLNELFKNVFPSVHPIAVHYDTCVTTRTPSRRPFIDLVTPQLGVALGGNGYAAKACDEIARLAVQLLVTGYWSDQELPRDTFRAVFKPPAAKI